jgi:hypothetical protein
MTNKAERITIDGISYELTDQGARKITPHSTSHHNKLASKTVARQSYSITVPVVIVTMLRMLCSIRFLLVLLIPVVALIAVKTTQLNSYELAQTAANWFSNNNLHNLRFIAGSIGVVIVSGWLLEPWFLKLFSLNRPPYWQLVGGLIASTSYYLFLMGLGLVTSLGLSILVFSKVYAVLPVLAVFVVICLWAITVAGLIWCWARRNQSLIKNVGAVGADKLLLLPKVSYPSHLATVGKSFGRFLPATMTFVMLVLVVSFEILLFLSGFSSGWQVLGIVFGICLTITLLSFDHIQKQRYWLDEVPHTNQFHRYPAFAMTLLGVDSLLLVFVLVGVAVQLVLPKAFDTAHLQSVKLKKLIEQSNLIIPSAKQVKPFDNTTKNK